MIAQLSEKISSFFIENEIIKSDDREIYEYSFEILLSTVLNFIAVIAIAFFTQQKLNTFSFLVGFIPMRCLAGGYHAQNHFRCFMLLLTVYSAFLVLLKITPPYFFGYLVPFLCVVCTALVFALSPVEDANKPLTFGERAAFKRKSRIGISIFCTSALIMSRFVFLEKISYAFTLGILTASFSLLATYIKRSFSRHS